MTNPPPDQLFAERPVRSDFARRSGPSYGLRRFITISVLVTVISIGLYVTLGHTPSSTPEEIPTIKAEGAYKQRPEQPGGIDIPHQDVQVYQALDANNAAKPQIEHLLPPPEEPHPVEASVAAANVVAPIVASTQPESLIPAAVSAPVSTPVPPAAAVVPPVSTQQTSAAALPPLVAESVTPKAVATTVAAAPVPVAAPVASVAAVTAPATHIQAAMVAPVTAAAPLVERVTAPVVVTPAPISSPAPVAASKAETINDVLKDVVSSDKTSGPVVQLASIQDQAAAQQAMAKLQTKYASVLNGKILRLVRADLGAKGIYYRIQSSPMSEDKAKSLCTSLKNLNAGCILVRP